MSICGYSFMWRVHMKRLRKGFLLAVTVIAGVFLVAMNGSALFQETKVQAQASIPVSVFPKEALREIAKNNIYVFVPSHQGEVGEDEQVEYVVRQFAGKYQVFSVDKEYVEVQHGLKQMVQATIYIGAKQF
jgi:hypothetical protein